MAIILPDLPYAYDAKHHATYVANANAALEKHPEIGEDLEALLADVEQIPADIRQALINNGGGHLNHALFWELLSPEKQEPTAEVAAAINEAFGSFEAFQEAFTAAATTRFGSGWAWLVVNAEGKLEVVSTANQDTPISDGKKPILALDVWEHAYYLNYRNVRPNYIKAFFEIINWNKVAKSVDQKATEETVVPVEHKEKEAKTETLALRSKRSKKSRSKSSRDDKKAYLILAFLGVLVILLFVAMLALAGRGKQASNTGSLGNIFGSNSKVTKKEDKEKEEKVTPTNKSAEAKQAVMEADADTMYGNGLYYDYANMTLSQVVEAFMADQGIESSQIAFSYKNTKTNEQYSMNDTQPMTAGSTYKLPLNMLVMDEVNKGKLSLTERFDITNTEYEYQGEHDNYVAAFGGSMTIPEMQEYSLVYSENTPAYALAERLGGMEKFYGMLDKYGKSKGEVKTIQMHGNKTS